MALPATTLVTALSFEFEDSSDLRTHTEFPDVERLNRLEDSGDLNGALDAAQQGMRDFSDFDIFYVRAADILMKMAFYDDAEEILSLALSRCRTKACVCNQLADLERTREAPRVMRDVSRTNQEARS